MQCRQRNRSKYNIRPEKHAIKPVVTPQKHNKPETKFIYHAKPRIGQGRAGIKKKVYFNHVIKLSNQNYCQEESQSYKYQKG